MSFVVKNSAVQYRSK